MQNENVQLRSYSIFRVAQEYFAMEADMVLEIMLVPHITGVPKGLPFMKGLFNHRGRILSLTDLSIRLNQKPIAIDKKTPLIVAHYSDENKTLDFGILVNEVIEVIEMNCELILEYSSLECVYDVSFIRGIFQYKDLKVTLLDIKKTFEIK